LKVLIIGAGFFGSSIAIKIKENFKNSKVTLCEKKHDILLSASGKNQFRCHLGFHYPRSDKTIQECKKSFLDFDKYFNDTYLKSENFYAISRNDSKISFEEYLKSLDKNNLKYKIESNDLLKQQMIQGSIKVDEKIISISLVRKKLWKMMKNLNIEIKLNTKVHLHKEIKRDYDYIILCTYDENNKNLKNINYIKKEKYYYQLVEKILVKPPKIYQSKSFVILDGPFMCIDPYENSNYSILGSVKKSVVKSIASKIHNFDEFPALKKYLFKNSNLNIYSNIKNDFKNFFLNFEETKYFKSFFVVRATVKNKNDERVTRIINNNKIINVFSGKWVNCMTTAKKIVKMLK